MAREHVGVWASRSQFVGVATVDLLGSLPS